MASLAKKAGWAAEYLLLRTVAVLTSAVPERRIPGVARAMGGFVYHVLRIRRSVVVDNLTHAFGDQMDAAAIADIARRTYTQIATTFIEFFRLPRLGEEGLRARVRLCNADEVRAIRDSGQCALLTTGHFGNWEYLGASMNAYGFPTSFLVKTQSNPWVDRVQNGIRASGGMGVIRQNQVRRLMEVLRKGEYLGILPDQNAGGEGIFIDFMGRRASASRGLAFLAWKYNCPIVPAVAVRQPDGTHLAVFKPAIWPRPEWDEETAVREMTQAFAAILEEFIREYPDHYFWVHRRWKTRPPQERES